MPLKFAELNGSIERLAVIVGVAVAHDGQLAEWIYAHQGSAEIGKIDILGQDARFARLYIGKIENKEGRFELDTVRSRFFSETPLVTEAGTDAVVKKFERILGKNANVFFSADFVTVAESLPNSGAIKLLSGVAMNIEGVGAFLSAGTLSLNDNNFHTLRWKPAAGSGKLHFTITGLYPDVVINEDLAVDMERDAIAAFERFILEKKSSKRQG